MKNVNFNQENEFIKICDKINVCGFQYLGSESHIRTDTANQKCILVDVVDDNTQLVTSGTFAYPKTAVKKRKFVNHTVQSHHIKLEETKIVVTEFANTKPRKPRRKKLAKRKANFINWDELCFQPEIEAKYHCNVKPNDYAQYLNNPVSDPMFCQFDSTIDVKHNCEEEVILDFEVLIDQCKQMSEIRRIQES